MRHLKQLFAYRLGLLFVVVALSTNSVLAAEDTLAKKGNPDLSNAFAKGSVNGRFRYYFSSTINKGALSDYYANAVGAYLKYSTRSFHRFQFVMGSSFTYNIWSSDFTKTDPVTGSRSRYESSLFDLTDPTNRFNMARLDEVHLKYQLGNIANKDKGGGAITLGKQIVNTPLINEQDGRMRPSAVDALWVNYHKKKTAFEGGWIWGVSPRGTPKWYSTARSIGVYGGGLNVDGSKGNYEGNVKTVGVFVASYKYTSKLFDVKIWDYFVENIFNTAMVEASHILAANNHSELSLAGQIIRQDAVKDGGNPDPSKAYINPGAGCWVFSGSLQLRNPDAGFAGWFTSLNYTRITGNNRFQMPREWGREPFFTFIPRERNEGAGDVHAAMIAGGKEIRRGKLYSEINLGYYHLPDIKVFRFNKYSNISYGQLLARLRYSFSGTLKGLKADLFYVYKKNMGEDYGNLKYVINRVDMSLFNLVFNYDF